MTARSSLWLAAVLCPAGFAQQTQTPSARLHVPVPETAFGTDVAVSGDWAIVTAHGKTDPAEGSVFFFRRGDQGWELAQEIPNPVQDYGKLIDLYAHSVDIEGDLAAVNARHGGPNDEGMVFVYELQGERWVEVDRLLPSDGHTKDLFGYSVAITGDRIVAGSPLHEHPPLGKHGAVYVFERTPKGWVQTDEILAPPRDITDPHERAYAFGWSVAAAGDWFVATDPWSTKDGDGGYAYVFRLVEAHWVLDDVLVDTVTPFYDDRFGWSVALSRDARTIVVGEPQDKSPWTPRLGTAFVFERKKGDWNHTALLKASDGSIHNGYGDRFGESVDVDDDHILVGAPRANGNGFWRGAGYLFERVGKAWIERARLFRDPPSIDTTLLGTSVSLSGAFTLVGDPIDDVDYVETGAVHVFEVELGTAYCPAVDNSTGEDAILAVLGSEDVTEQDLLLSARDLPPLTFGLFFFGPGQTQTPLGDGLLCVGGNLVRLEPVAAVGPTGATMHTVDFSVPAVSTNLVPGSTWNFQLWYRDIPGGPAGSNLSNAVQVGFQ